MAIGANTENSLNIIWFKGHMQLKKGPDFKNTGVCAAD